VWERVAKKGSRQKEVEEWGEGGLLSRVGFSESTVKFAQQGPGPELFLCISRVNRMQRNVFRPDIIQTGMPTHDSKKSFLK